MEQNLRRKGLMNWLLLLVLGSAGAFVASYAGSATGMVSAVFMGLGFLVAIVSYLQMRLEEREQIERLEFDELKRTGASDRLFSGEAEDTFPAKQARVQFERFVAPGFAILLLVLQAGGAYLLWKHLLDEVPPTQHQATVAMALNGLFALLFFQFGRYSAVLARLEKVRLLRPQATYLLLGALLSATTAVVEVAGWAGRPGVDLIVARVLIVLLGLVAIENLATLVFEIYRPRVKGQAEHPLYESRLIGILSQPGGLITTAAQAIDYQFGFKVSETWFYRFLERALAWLILLQLGVLLLSSCFVFLEPGEQALLERFGRPVAAREVLKPGPHVKWPWPIDKVYRYKTEQIQSFLLGIVAGQEYEEERVILWTRTHAEQESNMLVASRALEESNADENEQTVPVNLLSVSVPVQYQVSDLPAYVYNNAEAGKLLENLANRVLTRYLVNVDLYELMGPGRRQAADSLKREIQEAADERKLGVRILFVGMHGIHPPVKVAPEFELVDSALQAREATNHYARAYAAEIVPKAKAEAARRVNEAEAQRTRLVSVALANAGMFTDQLTAYEASPEVYRLRKYLATLRDGLGSARKYVVVPTNTHEVYQINLEDKVRQDLMDVSLPAARAESRP